MNSPGKRDATLEQVTNAYESKYGAHFTAPEGTWFGLSNAIRTGKVLSIGSRPPRFSVSPEASSSARPDGALLEWARTSRYVLAPVILSRLLLPCRHRECRPAPTPRCAMDEHEHYKPHRPEHSRICVARPIINRCAPRPVRGRGRLPQVLVLSGQGMGAAAFSAVRAAHQPASWIVMA